MVPQPVLEARHPSTQRRSQRRTRQTCPARDLPWNLLDEIDLSEHWWYSVPTLRACPAFLRGAWRGALSVALDELCRATRENDHVAEVRSWNFFLLLPSLLLRRTCSWGAIGKEVLFGHIE